MSHEKEIADKMNLDRTDAVFDALVKRSKITDTSLPLDEMGIKQTRAVISSGNLHVATARAKLSALKIVGYRDNMDKLKHAVEARVRRARKPRRD